MGQPDPRRRNAVDRLKVGALEGGDDVTAAPLRFSRATFGLNARVSCGHATEWSPALFNIETLRLECLSNPGRWREDTMAVNSLVRGAAALFILIATASTAARATQDRFVVDLASEPSTLDPHIQWNPDSYFVYRNIFDNLLSRDDKGAIVPEIATAWRHVSDTTLEFDIRTDARFHDGSKLTAEDVVFSIKRIVDPKFGSPQLSQFSKIADATRDGPSKVVIQLKSPYSAILAQLVKLSIVPKHVVEKEGNDRFNLNPIGSGPYKFISWDRGVAVTLARNDAYWGRKGPFPQAVFRAVPNAATRLADVQASAADLARAMNSDQGKQLDDFLVAASAYTH